MFGYVDWRALERDADIITGLHQLNRLAGLENPLSYRQGEAAEALHIHDSIRNASPKIARNAILAALGDNKNISGEELEELGNAIARMGWERARNE